MKARPFEVALLLLLAAVFTIGLTFASLEFPYWIDELLQKTVASPGFDSHADQASRIKTELYIQHYHLRTIGYICFGLTIALIVLGFATRRSGLAAVGALAFMLPVFAQFAGVMFFLAGLGALNVLWFPVLDLSFDVQKLGLIIRLPFDLLMWLFRQIGINGYWPLVYFFILTGLLVFFLGTFAWLLARARGSEVADFWAYRISRHPQYLGWILWSYGIYLLLMRMQYPRRSWGIDASLPWLISTMVIIGVALVEELSMRRQFGASYADYQQTAPFLFPVPAFVGKLCLLPLRVLHRQAEPQKRRDVVFLISTYLVIFIGTSALFYTGGLAKVQQALQSSEENLAGIRETIERMISANGRRRYFVSLELAEMGAQVIPQLLDLMSHEDQEVREYAIELLGGLRSRKAIPLLISSLEDPHEDNRRKAVDALAEIGAPEAEVAITRLLDDPVPHIRLTAARGTGSFGSSRGR